MQRSASCVAFVNEDGSGSRANGACVEKMVMINPGMSNKFKKWTYKKVSNQYLAEAI